MSKRQIVRERPNEKRIEIQITENKIKVAEEDKEKAANVKRGIGLQQSRL